MNGLELSAGQLAQFEVFKENLLDWNTRMNLTAITDDTGIWQKHFADSLTLLPFLPVGEFSMIDVGSGAGFPGIPIKIMRPDVDLTLLDSTRKRVTFLEDSVRRLGLESVDCVHARAEEYRGSFDVCTTRAVARLDKLIKWCMHLLKPGGVFLAMKGSQVEAELEEAMPVIKKLGGELVEVRKVEVVPGLVARSAHCSAMQPGLLHSVVVICYTGGKREGVKLT